MTAVESPDLRFPIAAAAMVLAAAEGALTAAAAGGAGLAAILAAHVVLLVLSGLWLSRPARRQSRYGTLLWVSTAAFGVLGGIGVLLAMVLERYHARHATSIDEWHAELFPPSRRDEQAALWRRVGQRAHDRPGDQDVTSFLDALTFGSVPQRQATIAIIAQQFNPAFAPALRAALRDEHNVIRVQAATAIARLEQLFFERTLALESALADAPDDADAVLALATHNDDQAFAGLFDPAREQQCRLRSEELYGRYLQLRPDDGSTQFRLARLLLRRGLAAEAEPRFRTLVDAGDPSARLWLMECLFAQRRFSELRCVARDAAGIPDLTPDTRGTIVIWCPPGEAA